MFFDEVAPSSITICRIAQHIQLVMYRATVLNEFRLYQVDEKRAVSISFFKAYKSAIQVMSGCPRAKRKERKKFILIAFRKLLESLHLGRPQRKKWNVLNLIQRSQRHPCFQFISLQTQFYLHRSFRNVKAIRQIPHNIFNLQ